MNSQADVRYPVSLVLSRKWQQTGQWRFPKWEIVVVLPFHANPNTNAPDYRHVHTEQDGEHILWSGLWLEFFRDGLQGYYENLTGVQPSLFVLCHDDDSAAGLRPIVVSANHADAEGHMEIDGMVLTTPLLVPYSTWMADYILQNQTLLDRQLEAQQRAPKGKHRHA
jgi:hypothetical protein